MSKKIQKHISIKQICTACKKTFSKNIKVVDVPRDYKISDIKSQITPPENHCPNCKKQADAKFSFYHEETL